MNEFQRNLMAGDWVLYRKDGQSDSFPVQVTPSMLCNELALQADRYDYVPLTVDILVGNGFSDGNGYLFYTIDDSSYLEYYPYKKRLRRWYEGVDEWENHSNVKDIVFQCSCGYVHEFQHALKLCGVPIDVSV